MPDITMCTGYVKETDSACPLRDSCYRFTATPSEHRQSYFVEAPYIDEPDGTSCAHFLEVASKSQYKRFEVQVK